MIDIDVYDPSFRKYINLKETAMKTEGMNEKLLLRLSKLTEFQNTDTNIKYQQQKLNQDINDFMVKELGMEGNYTIIDIAKKLLETSFEPSRIITP